MRYIILLLILSIFFPVISCSLVETPINEGNSAGVGGTTWKLHSKKVKDNSPEDLKIVFHTSGKCSVKGTVSFVCVWSLSGNKITFNGTWWGDGRYDQTYIGEKSEDTMKGTRTSIKINSQGGVEKIYNHLWSATKE